MLGGDRRRPLFRAANCKRQKKDGDNRKCDYGCGSRALERERYDCGRSSHSDRDRHRNAHSSHEKSLHDIRGWVRTMCECCCCCSSIKTQSGYTCICSLMAFRSHSYISEVLFLSISHRYEGESHAEQAGDVLILCVLNLALCPPTDSFTK